MRNLGTQLLNPNCAATLPRELLRAQRNTLKTIAECSFLAICNGETLVDFTDHSKLGRFRVFVREGTLSTAQIQVDVDMVHHNPRKHGIRNNRTGKHINQSTKLALNYRRAARNQQDCPAGSAAHNQEVLRTTGSIADAGIVETTSVPQQSTGSQPKHARAKLCVPCFVHRRQPCCVFPVVGGTSGDLGAYHMAKYLVKPPHILPVEFLSGALSLAKQLWSRH